MSKIIIRSNRNSVLYILLWLAAVSLTFARNINITESENLESQKPNITESASLIKGFLVRSVNTMHQQINQLHMDKAESNARMNHLESKIDSINESLQYLTSSFHEFTNESETQDGNINENNNSKNLQVNELNHRIQEHISNEVITKLDGNFLNLTDLQQKLKGEMDAKIIYLEGKIDSLSDSLLKLTTSIGRWTSETKQQIQTNDENHEKKATELENSISTLYDSIRRIEDNTEANNNRTMEYFESVISRLDQRIKWNNEDILSVQNEAMSNLHKLTNKTEDDLDKLHHKIKSLAISQGFVMLGFSKLQEQIEIGLMETSKPTYDSQVVLYYKTNYEGKSTSVNFNDCIVGETCCKNLSELNNDSQSIVTFGSCVEVYLSPNCSGESKTYIDDSADLGSFRDAITSVKPC